MRLIDADAFVKEMEDRYNSAISWGKRAVANHDDEMRIRAEQASFSFVEASMTAKKMPTIDGIVVRCEDCRWYEIAELKADGTEDERFKPSLCVLQNRTMDEDFYCADGERKEE